MSLSTASASPSADVLLSNDRSRQIVDGLAEGYVSFDADWRFTDCNDAAERLLGRKREDLLGENVCDIAGFASDSPFAALARRVAAAATPEDAEICFRQDRRSRVLAVRAFPLGGGVGAVWRDITAARAAERRLALSEARYREIADGVPAAAWLSRADGRIEYVNQAMIDALGRPRRALLGEGWTDCIDPEDRPRLLAARAEAHADHSSFRYDGRFRRPDGSLRIIHLYGRPRFDAHGAFRGYVGVAADITEDRDAQQRQRLLINELNHRVKNTLATVQSVVRHTLRDHDTPKGVERAVTERLVALSAAHDVLSRENWRGATLAEVVGHVMQPFHHAGRILAAGPDVWIAPRTVIALSMALLELATNAAKHGALSSPGGRVEIHWTKDDGAVTLEWCERGGPAARSPDQLGYGATLLGRVLAGELGNPAEMDFAPEGLICRLRAPTADPDAAASNEPTGAASQAEP
jgi:PAS domain S-box-containing protein